MESNRQDIMKCTVCDKGLMIPIRHDVVNDIVIKELRCNKCGFRKYK